MSDKNQRAKLSICIPTYNRIQDLRECLGLLIPQVADVEGQAEIVIVNNASTDGTREFIQELPSHHSFIRAFSNNANLGFDGNIVKCIEYARGEYTALLSDDDRYMPGLINTILKIVSKQDYALINLNYYAFLQDPFRPYKIFAPAQDVSFSHAYDILRHPFVGHLSGFVYKSDLAKKTLAEMLARDPVVPTDRSRGVYYDLAVRVTKASSLPAHFIGERKLATKPSAQDYGAIDNICLQTCRYFRGLLAEGIITQEEVAFRDTLVVNWLPRLILMDAPVMSDTTLIAVTNELTQYLGWNKKYRFIELPMLWAGRFWIVKRLYRVVDWLGSAVVRLLHSNVSPRLEE